MKVYAVYEVVDWDVIPHLYAVYASRIDAENATNALSKGNEESRDTSYYVTELDVISDSQEAKSLTKAAPEGQAANNND